MLKLNVAPAYEEQTEDPIKRAPGIRGRSCPKQLTVSAVTETDAAATHRREKDLAKWFKNPIIIKKGTGENTSGLLPCPLESFALTLGEEYPSPICSIQIVDIFPIIRIPYL